MRATNTMTGDRSSRVARLSVCAIVAQLGLASLVPLSAEEHCTVTMEVLTVKEVEVCPQGYERGCGEYVDVLNELDRLRRESFSKRYELDLCPQSDNVGQQVNRPVELELNQGMRQALSRYLGDNPTYERRFAGLFVFHVDGRFRSILFWRHGDSEPRGDNVDGDRRWYVHRRGTFLRPNGDEVWTVQLDGSTIDFKFISPQR